MKPFKSTISIFILCFVAAYTVHAQQFKLAVTPNSAYYLDNIYDLRNTGTAANRPAGLVRFVPNAGATFNGTSIQHYNTATGAVNNPIFNYIISPNNTLRNLRGAKFTEGFGSYFMTGMVNETTAAGGASQDQIFLMRVNNATAAIQASRYVRLQAGWSRLEVSNILLVGDNALYVSGTVLVNNLQNVFLLRTDLNFNAVGFFRLYPLANRNFSTGAQCLINEGANGLVLGGIDSNNGRAVTFRVNPANGALLAAPRAFGLCTPAACRRITRMSIGRSGNFPNMMVQTNFVNNTLYNVAQMNNTWTAPVAQSTHTTVNQNWDIRSSRYENAGILLGHYDGTNLRYNPPTIDVTNVVRQSETITLTGSNRIFTVGKYRDIPTNSTRFLGELQPSSPNCQSNPVITFAPEVLRLYAEVINSPILQFPMFNLPTQRVDLPTSPIQICTAALAGAEVEDREAEQEENWETALNNGQVKAYPNPFRQELMVELTDGNIAEIMFMDMTGRVIRHEQLGGSEPTFNLNLSEINSGLYLLRVRDTENQWHYRKVMKE
jgi:Secretion system C-terminal sorting domain